MKTVIIAGGKGTRLGLKDIPKPMVKIGDKPLLEYQVELAIKYGCEEIYILTGYLSEVIENYFKDGSDFGIKINYIKEPYPLGTAGCLKLLENKINEKFMVFYGDIVMDFDINSFIRFDKNHNDSIATILLHPNNHPYDSDLVEIDNNSKVVKILPKPHDENLYYQNLVNAAVYILSPKIFSYIKENKAQDFAKDILPLAINSENIYGYKTAEYIKDMGTLDRFEETKKDLLSGKVSRLNKQNKRPCIFLDRDGVINKDMVNNPNSKDFELLSGVSDAIKMINKSNYLSVVVTNQPAIAKGFLTFDEADRINKKMETLLGVDGAFLDGIYYCPHHPEKGFEGEVKELKKECECRKPKPGMLLKAKNDFNIDIEDSWMIGDSERDILAGKNCGCKTVLIADANKFGADMTASNLYEAVQKIMGEV